MPKNKKPKRKPVKRILRGTVEHYLLNSLEGEERELALKNLPKDRTKIKVDKPSEALFQAFQFQNTPEGFEYWKNVFDRLKAKEDAN